MQVAHEDDACHLTPHRDNPLHLSLCRCIHFRKPSVSGLQIAERVACVLLGRKETCSVNGGPRAGDPEKGRFVDNTFRELSVVLCRGSEMSWRGYTVNLAYVRGFLPRLALLLESRVDPSLPVSLLSTSCLARLRISLQQTLACLERALPEALTQQATFCMLLLLRLLLTSSFVRHRTCVAVVQHYAQYKARQRRRQMKQLMNSSNCLLDVPLLNHSPVHHAKKPRAKVAAPHSTSERTTRTCSHHASMRRSVQTGHGMPQKAADAGPLKPRGDCAERSAPHRAEGRWGQAPEGDAWQLREGRGPGCGRRGAAVGGSEGTGSNSPLHGKKRGAEVRGKEKGAKRRRRTRRPRPQGGWEYEWLEAFFATEKGWHGTAGQLHKRMHGRPARRGQHSTVRPSCFTSLPHVISKLTVTCVVQSNRDGKGT
jgi:hypothetical protein